MYQLHNISKKRRMSLYVHKIIIKTHALMLQMNYRKFYHNIVFTIYKKEKKIPFIKL